MATWLGRVLLCVPMLAFGSEAARESASTVLLAAPAATTADFERAAALVPAEGRPKLRNGRVIPHWIGTRDEFWYRRETVDGHEFVRVDAATGQRHPAFDHAALARALQPVVGSTVLATALPFDRFDYADREQSVTMQVDGRGYRCRLRPASCEPVSPAVDESGDLVSPDGRHAVRVLDGNLWLHERRSGTQRRITVDGETNFGFGICPDNWHAAFIPRTRDGARMLPWESFWSPDSTRVVVTRVDQRHVAPYPYVESVPADGSFRPKGYRPRVPLVGERPATVEWFVFDVPSGERRRIEFPYDRLLALQVDLHAVRRTWWSEDNAHLYVVAFGDNMEAAYLFDVDVTTGAVRTVIEEEGAPRVDLNSTSYNRPNVAVVGQGDEVIWFSQRDGWGHLYLYNGRTGVLENRITAGHWLVRDLVHVDERSRRIYFTAGGREPGSPYHRYLYRVDFDGTDLSLLTPEPGDHLITGPGNDIWSVDGTPGYAVVSPSGRYMVYNHAPLDRPTEAVIRRTADGQRVAVFERADATNLHAAGYRSPEEFVVKAADGTTDLWGVLYKPPHFDPTRRYPVVDAQYASPLTAVAPRNFVQAVEGPPGYGTAAALAQLGFIVMVVDARGTVFRDRAFLHYSFGRLETMGLEDHVAALRQLAADRPYLDLDRVGITGMSFGGWTTIRGLLEFPDVFRVGVAGVPPGAMHNMPNDYHWTAFQGRPVYADGGSLRLRPDAVPQNYRIADSIGQASRLAGRLMIVMGEIDENVLTGSTLQFVDALIAADRDFDLLYLPGTTHSGSDTAYVRRRTWQFLVRHLQDPAR